MNEAVESLATMVTGGVVGREFDRSHAPAGHDQAEGAGGACANCGAIRYGPFCHACGQSGHIHRNFKALGHDIAHGVFHFEGKTWHTLPMLAWRPGELTRRYVHGERAKFVSPMALFLFSVFLLFASISFVSRPEVSMPAQKIARAKNDVKAGVAQAQSKLAALEQRRTAKLIANPRADVSSLDERIAEAREDAKTLGVIVGKLPDAKPDAKSAGEGKGGGVLDGGEIDTGYGVLDTQIAHIRENPALFAYKMKMASYKFSWALIPISVPFIWLLFFWRRDVGLYDHAIFAIYSLSFMTLAAVALIGLHMAGVRSGWLVLGALLIPPAHIYRQLKGAYRLGRFGAAWRTTALLAMTGITSSLFALLLFWLETD